MIKNLTELVAEKFSPLALFPSCLKLVSVDLHLLQEKIGGGDDAEAVGLYLNHVEQERYLAFRYEKRKVEWLGGRIAAKCAALQLIMNSTAIAWKDVARVSIASTEHGKPFLQGSFEGYTNQLPSISISHTTGLAVGLACDKNCGVDVQEITPAVERVQDRFCSQEEQKRLAVIAARYNRQIALAFLWSAKEAVKKSVPAQHSAPGFMEILLCDVKKGDNGYLFEIEISAQSESINGKDFVWVCLWQDLSFAMTVFS